MYECICMCVYLCKMYAMCVWIYDVLYVRMYDNWKSNSNRIADALNAVTVSFSFSFTSRLRTGEWVAARCIGSRSPDSAASPAPQEECSCNRRQTRCLWRRGVPWPLCKWGTYLWIGAEWRSPEPRPEGRGKEAKTQISWRDWICCERRDRWRNTTAPGERGRWWTMCSSCWSDIVRYIYL